MGLTPEQKKARRRAQIKERRFTIYRRITFIVLGFILVGILWSLIQKDKDYSETENRMLAQKPELTLSSLSSGKFMKDMENYVTDQFFFRNQWIKLKLTEDMVIGKRESNGVYIVKKHHLLEIQDEPDKQAVATTSKAIADFSAKHQDLNQVMTLVPNAAYICNQLRPMNAPVHDQSEDISFVQNIVGTSINFVDLTDTMKLHKTEEIYYKTDHHWTSLGAQYAFEALAPALNIENLSTDYTSYPVTHNFQGTLTSKSGYTRAEDTIDIYVYNNLHVDSLVNYVDEQRKTASIYESSALEQKDKYEVFFGGNHTRIDIDSPGAPNRSLLIFKDSYANCFVQFLLPYYRNITIIDPRYYYDDIEHLISERGVTDILYLYNVNTFMSDTSLADILNDVGVEDTDTAPDAAPEGTTDGTTSDGAAEGTTDGTTSDGAAEGTTDSTTSDGATGDGAAGGTT